MPLQICKTKQLLVICDGNPSTGSAMAINCMYPFRQRDICSRFIDQEELRLPGTRTDQLKNTGTE